MSNSIGSLTEQQVTFLEENFVVFDPDTRECYEEFSRLQDSQVVFLGEMHHTYVLHQIQGIFLKLFADKNSCLLVEYLPPDQSINKDLIPDWPDLPSAFSVQGSDVRRSWASPEAAKWLKLEYGATTLELKQKNEMRSLTRQAAAILNRGLSSNEIELQEGKCKVSKNIQEKIETLYDTIMPRIDHMGDIVDQLVQQIHSIKLEKIKGPANVRLSNKGLLDKIEKVRSQFSKVFVIWGMAHFTADDELHQALCQRNIHYTILLPSEKRMDEARIESEWKNEKLSKLSLFLRRILSITKTPTTTGEIATSTAYEESTLSIPKVFKSFFHPEIQQIFKGETPEGEPILVNSNFLSEVCKKGNILTFPANTPILLEDFNTIDYNALQDLLTIEQDEKKLDKQENASFIKHLISGLENMLIFHNLSLKSIQVLGNLTFSFPYLSYKPSVQLLSDQSLTLALRNDMIAISASYLFAEMRRKRLNAFSMPAGQRLVFTDITLQEREDILKQPDPALFLWLNSRAPQNIRIILSDCRASVGRATISNNSGKVEGLSVISTTDFKISIERISS